MDVTMNEQDQMQAIRSWLSKNGKFLIYLCVAVLAISTGWNYYKKRQLTYSSYASALYAKMLTSYTLDNREEFNANAEYLIANYPKAPYAGYANFALAKQAVNDGKLDEAIAKLDSVIDGDYSQRLRQIARVRKARVQLAQDKTDDALATLEIVDDSEFMPLISEIRGDIFVAKGERQKARAQYQAALQKMPNAGNSRGILQMKFDQLAGLDNELV